MGMVDNEAKKIEAWELTGIADVKRTCTTWASLIFQ
jgi:hypothetical protein